MAIQLLVARRRARDPARRVGRHVVRRLPPGGRRRPAEPVGAAAAALLRPVDGDLPDRILELVDLPRSCRSFEDAFVRDGRHHVAADRATVIGRLDAWPIGAHWPELGARPLG